jgi:hypothetical protein
MEELLSCKGLKSKTTRATKVHDLKPPEALFYWWGSRLCHFIVTLLLWSQGLSTTRLYCFGVEAFAPPEDLPVGEGDSWTTLLSLYSFGVEAFTTTRSNCL